MEDRKMTFPEACGTVYAKGLQNYHDREINEKNFMSQSAFGSCMGRGKALSEEAIKRVDNFRALCIILHRRKKHEEDETIEITTAIIEEETMLLAVMPEEDIELAQTRSWWKN